MLTGALSADVPAAGRVAGTNAPAARRPKPAGGQIKAPPAGAPSAGTNVDGQPHINPVLLEPSPLVDGSNLVRALHGDQSARAARAAFEQQLVVARQLRHDLCLPQAKYKLTTLLESPGVPDDLRASALLEMAQISDQENQPLQALQIYSQFLHTYPNDPSVPEVLLRQGLLSRLVGAYTNALNKFFAVLSSSLEVKEDNLGYYQRLVLRAQTEIAETYYQQGDYATAAYNLTRLLKLGSPDLNAAQIRFKLILSLAALKRYTEVVSQAKDFLKQNPGQAEEPEVRYQLATSLKQLGLNQEAMRQVLLLLQAEQAKSAAQPAAWVSWQQRTGNDIANQLYNEGDYSSALQIYQSLLTLNGSAAWQMPVLYQIGLVLERLRQPAAASKAYDQIVALGGNLGTNAVAPSLATLKDMAQWRRNYLGWETNAIVAARALEHGMTSTNTPAVAK